jgi:hypothetical protein
VSLYNVVQPTLHPEKDTADDRNRPPMPTVDRDLRDNAWRQMVAGKATIGDVDANHRAPLGLAAIHGIDQVGRCLKLPLGDGISEDRDLAGEDFPRDGVECHFRVVAHLHALDGILRERSGKNGIAGVDKDHRRACGGSDHAGAQHKLGDVPVGRRSDASLRQRAMRDFG